MIARDKQLCLRLSKQEVETLSDLAEQVSLSKANLIRHLIKQYARRFSLADGFARGYS